MRINYFEGLKYNEILKFNRLSESNSEMFTPLKIAFLRNITIDNVINCLRYLCYKNKITLSVYQSEYDQMIQETHSSECSLYKFKPEMIFIYLNLSAYIDIRQNEIRDYAKDIINYIDSTVKNIRKNSEAVILINNFEQQPYENYGIYDYQRCNSNFYEITRWNETICEISSKYNGIYIVNIDAIQMRVGTKNYLDKRMFNLNLTPYTLEGAKAISFEYMKYINAFIGKTKKCVILDCDNTLWGGIVGEDGLGGIKIDKTGEGKSYLEFQKALLNLYKRGIILAICSKNNYNDVIEVFNNHPEMLLKENHFAIVQSNWNDKVSNIKYIVKMLNIAYDSVVFIDDSPFEIDIVNQLVPDVTTILLEQDHSSFAEIIESCGLFDNPVVSEEDKKRTAMYKSEIQRKILRESFGDQGIEDYLFNLGIEIRADCPNNNDYQRLSQLTQRTNQFNLTTKRYSVMDIESMSCREDYIIKCYRYKDKFGGAGIVGLVILKVENSDFIIDSLMLSCRVLGRTVEDAIIHDVIDLSKKRGIKQVYGEYKKTPKNEQVRDFYKRKGFDILKMNDENGLYVLREADFSKIISPKNIKFISLK